MDLKEDLLLFPKQFEDLLLLQEGSDVTGCGRGKSETATNVSGDVENARKSTFKAINVKIISCFKVMPYELQYFLFKTIRLPLNLM